MENFEVRLKFFTILNLTRKWPPKYGVSATVIALCTYLFTLTAWQVLIRFDKMISQLFFRSKKYI